MTAARHLANSRFAARITMRAAVVLAGVAMLTLGACKKEAVVAKDESVESVAKKVAAADMNPQPGRWEASFTLKKIDIPGLPPQAREAMGKQMSGIHAVATCLTPEQANKPDGGFFQPGAKDCKYDRFVMADGRIEATMTCGKPAAAQTMTLAGTYSDTEYDLEVTSKGDMQPGMPMTMELGVKARRTGACNGTEIK
jgi:hypothetical protein